MCFPKIIYFLTDWSDIRAGLKWPDFERDTLEKMDCEAIANGSNQISSICLDDISVILSPYQK
jgi:hypothetical protein